MVSLPLKFSPRKLMHDGGSFDTIVPISHFKRLSELLADSEGVVTATMRFELIERRVCAVGNLSAQVNVACQRCFVGFGFTIKAPIELTFVALESEIDELDDDIEPVLLDEQGQIHIVDLLEDELILQLPVAPLHPEIDVCTGHGYINQKYEFDEQLEPLPAKTKAVKKNPFHILKNLTEPD